MRQADEILPWNVTNISWRPFPGFFSFNPSIHFDPTIGLWRCLMRNADYSAPHGIVQANMRKGGRIQTRNVMAVLDPDTWRAASLYEMHEHDGLARNAQASAQGFEDLRLFRTERDGLVAIATAMMLRPAPEQKQEMVLLRLDDEYNVIAAEPIRGPWNDVPQKNWAPFDGALGIQFLYSIERGIVFNAQGPVISPVIVPAPLPAKVVTDRSGGIRYNGGVETRMITKPRPMERADGTNSMPREVRAVKSDWSSPGLRGGSQLIAIGDDRWLGIGHKMQWFGGKKNYWHVWFTCTGQGRLLDQSEPIKLSKCGIEFAAGLALEEGSDRLVVSYGTEDLDSWLAVTELSAVLEKLEPIEQKEAVA